MQNNSSGGEFTSFFFKSPFATDLCSLFICFLCIVLKVYSMYKLEFLLFYAILYNGPHVKIFAWFGLITSMLCFVFLNVKADLVELGVRGFVGEMMSGNNKCYPQRKDILIVIH